VGCGAASARVSLGRETKRARALHGDAAARHHAGLVQRQGRCRRREDRFTSGYQVVEYPHTRRRHLIHAAEAALKIIDVAIAPRLNVGT